MDARVQRNSRRFPVGEGVPAQARGVSKLDGSMTVEKADFHVDGASTLSLVGAAGTARLSAGGTSHLKLGEFLLKQCEIELDGASTARLTVRSDSPFKARLAGAQPLEGGGRREGRRHRDRRSEPGCSSAARPAMRRPSRTIQAAER